MGRQYKVHPYSTPIYLQVLSETRIVVREDLQRRRVVMVRLGVEGMRMVGGGGGGGGETHAAPPPPPLFYWGGGGESPILLREGENVTRASQ